MVWSLWFVQNLSREAAPILLEERHNSHVSPPSAATMLQLWDDADAALAQANTLIQEIERL